jgi:hypothetical protein
VCGLDDEVGAIWKNCKCDFAEFPFPSSVPTLAALAMTNDDPLRPAVQGEFSEVNGTNWMRRVVQVQNGDVVGVAMQQSDLPMVQFFHNGEPSHESGVVNRFRGTVYPAICLPQSAEKDRLKVSFVYAEEQFEHMSPAAKFGPIIVARSIV